MKIEDAVVQVDKLFNTLLVERIINYINFIKLDNMSVGSGIDTNIRNVMGRHLIGQNMTDVVLFKCITNEIFKILPNYFAKFPKLLLSKVNQIDLLKYEAGGKYEIHEDQGPNTRRALTCIINLNEGYEGGDLVIYDNFYKNEIKRLKLKHRSALFFPSNFLYPHTIEPIKSGTRYSVVAWLE